MWRRRSRFSTKACSEAAGLTVMSLMVSVHEGQSFISVEVGLEMGDVNKFKDRDIDVV